MENAADYAKLVALGKPDFIEIKSVTFCGESKAGAQRPPGGAPPLRGFLSDHLLHALA